MGFPLKAKSHPFHYFNLSFSDTFLLIFISFCHTVKTRNELLTVQSYSSRGHSFLFVLFPYLFLYPCNFCFSFFTCHPSDILGNNNPVIRKIFFLHGNPSQIQIIQRFGISFALLYKIRFILIFSAIPSYLPNFFQLTPNIKSVAKSTSQFLDSCLRKSHIN